MCYVVKLDKVWDDECTHVDFERNRGSVTVKLCMPESC